MGTDEQPFDLISGVYRRQYAGYTRGKRINSLALESEAWFWRVHAAADDFGNMHGEASLVYQDTVGRRVDCISVSQVDSWLAEMATTGLIRFYDVEGERYLHIVDFILRQPAGKNGKRVHRVPPSPWDDIEVSGVSSRNIQNNPSESSATITTTITKTITNPDASASGSPASSTLGQRVEDLSTVQFPLFPISAPRNKPNTWRLSDALIAELAATYPAVDVPAHCRRAWQWVMTNLGRRKTVNGMPKFLNFWMSKQQDRGGGPSCDPSTNAPRQTSSDRTMQMLKEKL